MRNSSDYRRNRFHSSGIATLEFAMALPVLLLLMVAITWLGFSVITQADMLIQSREKAWQKRFDNPGQKPLVFPDGKGAIKNPLYSTSDDYVTETATKAVNVSPIFKAASAPKASNTVLAGSWDYRAMDMNSPPNLKLAVIAATNAATGDLQNALGQLSGLAGSLSQAGSNILAKELSDFASRSSSSSGGKADTTAKEGNQQTDNQKEADRKDLQTKLQQKKSELQQTKQEIDQQDAQSKVKKDPPPLTGTPEEQKKQKEQQEKQQEDENKQNDRKMQLLKDKQKRLESEIDILQDKLDSLD